jgi:hypothetical protein
MILLSNIGTSDLQLRPGRTEPLPDWLVPYEKELDFDNGSKGARARLVGQALGEVLSQEGIQEVAKWLHFPILERVITYIINHKQPLTRIVLFVTDQADVDERYRVSDTVEYGNLFSSYFQHWKQSFKSKPEWNLIKDATVYPIKCNDNPSDYDAMNEFYRKNFTQRARWLQDTSGQPGYVVNVTGGTPAMNFMLMLNAISELQLSTVDQSGVVHESVRLVYVPRNRLPKSVDVGTHLRRVETKRTLLRLVEVSDYFGAYTYLETLDPNRDWPIIAERELYQLKELCLAANARINFDFEGALQHLDRARTGASQTMRRVIEKLTEDVEQLLHPTSAPTEIFWELIALMDFQLSRGQYLLFLAMLFRFVEGVYRHLAESFGIEMDDKGSIEKWVVAHPDVRENLENRKEPVRYQGSASRFLLGEVLKYLVRDSDTHKGILERLERFEKLANLRNKSVLAHDFQGVSLEHLARTYDSSVPVEEFPGRIIQELKDVLDQVIPASDDTDVYKQIRVQIRKVIDACFG